MGIVRELEQGALHAAPLLLGWQLVHESPEGVTSGYIVEVEAYTDEDPASHSFRGETLRTAALFKAAGTVYVYFTYGMHYCVNVVAGQPGRGEALLIRALEPLEGIELMKRRRKRDDVLRLTNGPAKLVEAMGITRAHNLTMINRGALRLEPGFTPEQIATSPRVGIKRAVEAPWRFYIPGNPYVSAGPRYTKAV